MIDEILARILRENANARQAAQDRHSLVMDAMMGDREAFSEAMDEAFDGLTGQRTGADDEIPGTPGEAESVVGGDEPAAN